LSLRVGLVAVHFFSHFLYRLFSSFLFLLHHHHWHFSAGSRGFLACATAAEKTSSTQMSCACPVRRHRLSYILRGFCFANCFTFRMPSRSKSRSMAGPMEISSPNCRALAVMKILLD